MSSQAVNFLEPFYPLDWDPGTQLVLQVFDSYKTCLRRLRPHILYLLQFIEKNPDIIPMPMRQRLKTLVERFEASSRRTVSKTGNLLRRRAHRTARELFKQILSIRMDFDELATRRVVEVIKQDHQAQKREQGDTAATDPGREISVPEYPSNWVENQDATILRLARNHPDEVQAALIWIRDALALYHDSATVEQAQSLLQLHAEWRGSVSKTTPWIETYLIPSPLRQTRSLRDRVMELKWGIASNQDTTLHLEKERRVQYVRRQQELAEATSELLDSPPSPTQWEFREIEADADGSQAFQETTSSNSE